MAVYCVYKNKKATSFQTVESFRKKMNFSDDIRLGYAGRLDPMAEGVFLILEGEDNKKQKDFFELDKEYEAEVIFGLSTDSSDVLGVLKNFKKDFTLDENQLFAVISKYIGKIKQKVSIFSAVRVAGKPMFWWAKNNQLDKIETPVYDRDIKDISLLSFYQIDGLNIRDIISESITDLNGHFRQEEIKNIWLDFFNNNLDFSLPMAKFKIVSSSGTFMRQLFDDIGSDIGCGAMILRLKRTRVGKFTLSDCIELSKTAS